MVPPAGRVRRCSLFQVHRRADAAAPAHPFSFRRPAHCAAPRCCRRHAEVRPLISSAGDEDDEDEDEPQLYHDAAAHTPPPPPASGLRLGRGLVGDPNVRVLNALGMLGHIEQELRAEEEMVRMVERMTVVHRLPSTPCTADHLARLSGDERE